MFASRSSGRDAGEAPPAPALLTLTGISKSYGPTRALTDATLSIRENEIRAVLGENGSGKSTLVKLLSGVVTPDGGSLSLGGRTVRLRSPREAKRFGIETVYQETLTIPGMSVLDNIFVGADGLFRFDARHAEQRRKASSCFEALGCSIALDREMATLGLSERQLITIARALVRPWKLLILDEATSSLDVKIRDGLFDFLRTARTKGSSIIFISHRMDEIASFADSVTLLQAGRTMETLPVAEATSEKLVSTISASRDRDVAAPAAARLRTLDRTGRRYRATDIVLRDGCAAISMEFQPGSIIGFGGLDGHGQAEFLSVVAGLAKPRWGRVEHETEGRWQAVTSSRSAFKNGICYVPRDRKGDGLFLGLSILDNFAIATLSEFSRFGFLKRSRLSAAATLDLRTFRTRYASLATPVGRLSGGNQQKVLLARWLAAYPRLLVLDDPLRGVDAATKTEIHEVFRGLAENGTTLLLLSSEIEELISLCDEVAVFREGQVFARIDRRELNKDAVIAAMFGKSVAVQTGPAT